MRARICCFLSCNEEVNEEVSLEIKLEIAKGLTWSRFCGEHQSNVKWKSMRLRAFLSLLRALRDLLVEGSDVFAPAQNVQTHCVPEIEQKVRFSDTWPGTMTAVEWLNFLVEFVDCGQASNRGVVAKRLRWIVAVSTYQPSVSA